MNIFKISKTDERGSMSELRVNNCLPQSSELIALRGSDSKITDLGAELDTRGHLYEQFYIRAIGENWESKAIQLLKTNVDYSENGQSISNYYLLLLDTVATLHEVENLWERFIELPEKSIQEISAAWKSNPYLLKSYLKILSKAECSEAVILGDDLKKLDTLEQTVLNIEIQSRVKNLSENFLKIVKEDTHTRGRLSKPLKCTSLVLLAGIYGEEKVSSIIKQKNADKIKFGLDVLLFLLEDDCRTDTPLLWQLQFINLESKQEGMFWMQIP